MSKKYHLIDYYSGKSPHALEELYAVNEFDTEQEAEKAREEYIRMMTRDKRIFNILVLVV